MWRQQLRRWGDQQETGDGKPGIGWWWLGLRKLRQGLGEGDKKEIGGKVMGPCHKLMVVRLRETAESKRTVRCLSSGH